MTELLPLQARFKYKFTKSILEKQNQKNKTKQKKKKFRGRCYLARQRDGDKNKSKLGYKIIKLFSCSAELSMKFFNADEYENANLVRHFHIRKHRK